MDIKKKKWGEMINFNEQELITEFTGHRRSLDVDVTPAHVCAVRIND